MGFLPPPPHQQSAEGSTNLSAKISPALLLTVVFLAIISFVGVVIHLIVKYILKSFNREAVEVGSTATAFQGQLQQLFHLHDAGVDQSFIDNLPVFLYKDIMGLKDPFDCVVCLCEFEPDDKLRLLPKCSHAFHVECIDSWLLSHSTCPLCRRSLIPDFSPCRSPVVLLLESASESSARDVASLRRDSVVLEQEEEENFHKEGEIGVEEDLNLASSEAVEAKVFVPVKLGKFRNAEAEDGEGTSVGNSDLNERRCFSMGAFEYVMNESSVLQVAIKPSKKQTHCQSMRELAKEFERTRTCGLSESGESGRMSNYECHKKESFSVSKIWMRSKKEKAAHEDCSRRALSLRLPMHWTAGEGSSKAKQGNAAGSMKAGSEVSSDPEDGGFSHNICSRADEAPSFARRTLLWIARRQKSKVVSHG